MLLLALASRRAPRCARADRGASLAPAAFARSLRTLRSLASRPRSLATTQAGGVASYSLKKLSRALASGARLARCASSLARFAAVACSRRGRRSLAPRSPGRSLAFSLGADRFGTASRAAVAVARVPESASQRSRRPRRSLAADAPLARGRARAPIARKRRSAKADRRFGSLSARSHGRSLAARPCSLAPWPALACSPLSGTLSRFSLFFLLRADATQRNAEQRSANTAQGTTVADAAQRSVVHSLHKIC